jgi:hypothetical protein
MKDLVEIPGRKTQAHLRNRVEVRHDISVYFGWQGMEGCNYAGFEDLQDAFWRPGKKR